VPDGIDGAVCGLIGADRPPGEGGGGGVMSEAMIDLRDETPKSWRLRRYPMVCVALTILIPLIITAVFVRSVSRPHFLMSVIAQRDSTTVQFIQPLGFNNHRMVSSKFTVLTTVEHSAEFELKNVPTKLNGAVIEFSDLTIPPGRIRIRFGGRIFDVMSARIIVDGKDEVWTPDSNQ
jgi:hypothetical protein